MPPFLQSSWRQRLSRFFFFLPWPLRSRPSPWFASDDFSSTWAEGVRFHWSRRTSVTTRTSGRDHGVQRWGNAWRVFRRVHDIALVSWPSPPRFFRIPNCNLTVELNTNNITRSLHGMLIAQVATFYRYHGAGANALTALVRVRCLHAPPVTDERSRSWSFCRCRSFILPDHSTQIAGGAVLSRMRTRSSCRSGRGITWSTSTGTSPSSTRP